MLAVIAALLFAVAYILNVTSTSTDAVFAPFNLMLVGLVLLALHLAGYGTSSGGWRWRGRRR